MTNYVTLPYVTYLIMLFTVIYYIILPYLNIIT